MASELTLHADIALRAIINGLRNAKRFDGFTSAYRQGQIDVIQVFLEPTPGLLEEANVLLADFKKRSDAADAEQFKRLARQIRNSNQQEQ